MEALLGPFGHHFFMPRNLMVMKVHPRESQDNWVLSGNSDQKGNRFLVQRIDLECKGLGAMDYSVGPNGTSIYGLDH